MKNVMIKFVALTAFSAFTAIAAHAIAYQEYNDQYGHTYYYNQYDSNTANNQNPSGFNNPNTTYPNNPSSFNNPNNTAYPNQPSNFNNPSNTTYPNNPSSFNNPNNTAYPNQPSNFNNPNNTTYPNNNFESPNNSQTSPSANPYSPSNVKSGNNYDRLTSHFMTYNQNGEQDNGSESNDQNQNSDQPSDPNPPHYLNNQISDNFTRSNTSTTTFRNDQTIDQDIRSSLKNDPKLSVWAQKIQVSSNNGVVTLSGRVADISEKSKVETMANQTQGVKRVINKLEIRP